MNNLEEEFSKLESEDKICGICACVKEEEIKLNCNHSFCYDCIYNWLKVKKQNSGSYDKLLECPYCKQQINKIPLRENYQYIRGINCFVNKSFITNNTIKICNAPIASKKGELCKAKGNSLYGYYCGRHKKFNLTNPKK